VKEVAISFTARYAGITREFEEVLFDFDDNATDQDMIEEALGDIFESISVVATICR
jgi:hypothetical protein